MTPNPQTTEIEGYTLLIRTILVLAALLVPTLATAQQPPPQAPNPEATALGQMVIDAAQREASLRVQLLTAQAKAAASAWQPPPTPPPPEAPK